MEKEIEQILWEVGGVPQEITRFYIIPRMRIKGCGCFFPNKTCKRQYCGLKKRKCIICRSRRRSSETHYCDRCKCRVSYCFEPNKLYLDVCMNHYHWNGKYSVKNKNAIIRRLNYAIKYQGASKEECLNFARRRGHTRFIRCLENWDYRCYLIDIPEWR